MVSRLVILFLMPVGVFAGALTYTNSPLHNPMRGLVPYYATSSAGKALFPHSLEKRYVSMRLINTASNVFDWSYLDASIAGASTNGCQLIFRPYLDYPQTTTAIPQWLLDGGLTTYAYTNYGNATSVSPDYEDVNLRAALTNFIAQLGARYNNDPRVAVVQMGLLGFWGEWHCGSGPPSAPAFASVEVQNEIYTAYTNAFPNTLLQERYPKTNNTAIPVGFADDSFAHDTFVAGGFMVYMTNANSLYKWTTNIIGGEIYPDFRFCIWDDPTCANEVFDDCVDATHVSWLWSDAEFTANTAIHTNAAASARAYASVARMGYELFVSSYTWTAASAGLSVTITNTGVAPFYYPWTLRVKAGAQTWDTAWDIRTILPGDSDDFSVTLTNIGAGAFNLEMMAVNPLSNGIPLSFANTTQDTNTGWLLLGAESYGEVVMNIDTLYIR